MAEVLNGVHAHRGGVEDIGQEVPFSDDRHRDTVTSPHDEEGRRTVHQHAVFGEVHVIVSLDSVRVHTPALEHAQFVRHRLWRVVVRHRYHAPQVRQRWRIAALGLRGVSRLARTLASANSALVHARGGRRLCGVHAKAKLHEACRPGVGRVVRRSFVLHAHSDVAVPGPRITGVVAHRALQNSERRLNPVWRLGVAGHAAPCRPLKERLAVAVHAAQVQKRTNRISHRGRVVSCRCDDALVA
jgi:hypothetical protein